MIDGAAAKPEPVQHGDDAGFLSALEELSGLSTASRQPVAATTTVSTTAPPVARRDKVELQPPRVRHRRTGPPTDPGNELPDAAADMHKDVLRELADLPAAEDWIPQIIPEPVDRELSSALEELAGTAASAQTLSKTPVTRRSRLLLRSLASLALCVCGTIVGYVWGRSGVPDIQESAASSVKNETTPAPGNAAQQAERVPLGRLSAVTGIIRYTDGSGELKPDAGSLILLLPAGNRSGLRLDARPLREGPSGPAKDAVEAALIVLGATITRAADDGSFSVPRCHSGEMKLLVISRHSSRPDSEPVAPELIEQLTQWFDSPTHITGRLAVQQASISALSDTDKSATGSNEIRFGQASVQGQ